MKKTKKAPTDKELLVLAGKLSNAAIAVLQGPGYDSGSIRMAQRFKNLEKAVQAYDRAVISATFDRPK